MDLTVVIPFRDGHATVVALIESLPQQLPIIIVDDCSDVPLRLPERLQARDIRILVLESREYFTGAVNQGIQACKTDVLILNQDSRFTTHDFFATLATEGAKYALIGERIEGQHPAWPAGYIHGTVMFMQRKALDDVGLLNAVDYPVWGSTCEWQVRAARKGWKILPLPTVEGFVHDREGQFGSSITTLLADFPEQRDWFIRTPPAVSVVVSCYNYGRYLEDLVHSFIGGKTSIGESSGQTFQSFEIILVDDHSTDDSKAIAESLADPWKGIFSIQTPQNGGTSVANNVGIEFAHGQYIAIICGDDMRTPDSLETMYRTQKANPHSFVYDNIQILTSAGIKTKIWKMPEFDFDELLVKNHVHAGIMFPKRAWQEVGGYPELMRDGREDWAFNVALGIAGYCGVHTHAAGYIYRRQGQNRTLQNTTPHWRARFSAQLQELYPEVYAGERPMSCCGGGGQSMRVTSNGTLQKVFPGGKGMRLIQYVGTSHGAVLYTGTFTGSPYKFSVKNAIRNVDVRDYEGLLELVENKRATFAVVAPVAPVAPVVEPEPEPEPVILEPLVVSLPPERPAEIVRDNLTALKGVGVAMQNLLYAEGYDTFAMLAAETSESLATTMYWTQAKAEKIIDQCR